MIIGITGTIGAGKGTVVSYLEEHYGFHHYSARTLLTEVLNERGVPIDRDAMRTLANELTERHGASYIATELFRRAKAPAVIESIRRPSEVEHIQVNGGVVLAVDADQELRFARIKKRGSETDDVSFETFQKQEAVEMNSDDPNEQNIASCIQSADYALSNNGTFEELHTQIDTVIRELQS